MNNRTIIREIAAVGALLGSYPADLIARRVEGLMPTPSSDPVIMIHGLGGNRSNLLAMATYLRLAGFDNLTYFEYPARQAVTDTARELGEEIARKFGDRGVHLVGHSLGGTIARRFATIARANIVLSVVTIGSPYSYAQWSPKELAFFGDEDPIVAPPLDAMLHPRAFGRRIVIENMGHLALVFHPKVLTMTAEELRGNRAPSRRSAA